MISSMTAFSRQSNQTQFGTLIWELRTVNHRFLDLFIRLPESQRSLESAIRDRLSQKIHRGKVEASLKIIPGNTQLAQIQLNDALVRQLAACREQIMSYFHDAKVDLLSLLNWPGVITSTTESESEQEKLSEEVLKLLEQSLNDLVSMRQREGAQIETFINRSVERLL